MSDNATFNDAAGNPKTLRMEDIGGVLSEKVKSAPWVETPYTGFQTLTITSSTVVKVAAGQIVVPAGATHCYLSVEGAPIRFTNTGDAPTTTKGHELVAGAGPIEIANVALLQLIALSASAIAQLTFHGYV